MFTVKTKIDIAVQKALSRRLYRNSLIAMIVGAIGLLVYLVVATIFENPYLDILLVFAIPFGFGLVYVITINKLMKNVELINQTNEYTFEESFFTVTTTRNAEVTGSAKIYYKELYKNREEKDYIFMYINKTSAIAVQKSNMTNDELIILRSLLDLELMPKGM